MDIQTKLDVQTKKILTVPELSEYISMSRWSIYSKIKNREIPFIELSHRVYRFNRERIDKWMEKKEVGTVKDHFERIAKEELNGIISKKK